MNVISLAEARSRRQGASQPTTDEHSDWVAKIVVVAADDDWRAAFRVFLWGQPYETQVIAPPAEWGEIAVLNPDVLVLDLDHCQTRLLRHAYKLKMSVLGRFVPVIGVAGESTHESRLHAFASGVDQWLPKPTTCEEIRFEVLSALRARQNYRTLLAPA